MSEAAALITLVPPEGAPKVEFEGALPLRAVIAHDWLVQYGGSERVVEELRRLLPRSRLVTSVLDVDRVPATLADAEATFLQHIPGARSHHRWLLPAMPLAWRAVPRVRDVDVVVSSSHACAKAIRVAQEIPHICYCHTPMRYAWDFASEQTRVAAAWRQPARLAMTAFRRWDVSAARPITRFVANSTAVASRISAAYGRSAVVIHPPVRTEFFTPGMERGDFFLYVGRLVAYKQADLVIEAFSGLPECRLIVVGRGHLEQQLRRQATPNVTFLGSVDDDRLRSLYRAARALVYPANEDFGIAMAEAQACGTPVIGLAHGGARDIVEPGVTGWLIRRADVGLLRSAVKNADDLGSAKIRASAERFSERRFRQQFAALLAETVGGS